MTRTQTFEELFRDCQQTAVHLEMRDTYMKSDPAFIDWKADITLDPAERRGDWHRIVTEATSRGVEVRRARVAPTPVSEYIHFEYDVTEGLDIAAGEDVRWLSRRSATALALPGNDFWLFDSSLVLVNHFDGEGENMEVELTDDPEVTKLSKSTSRPYGRGQHRTQSSSRSDTPNDTIAASRLRTCPR